MTHAVTGHHLFCEICLAVSQRFNLNKYERVYNARFEIELSYRQYI